MPLMSILAATAIAEPSLGIAEGVPADIGDICRQNARFGQAPTAKTDMIEIEFTDPVVSFLA